MGHEQTAGAGRGLFGSLQAARSGEENVLQQDVVVVGLKDAQWGEAVCAVVELRAGKSLALDELREFLRERIAGYKLPRTLRVVAELPRTATGKLQRGSVRAQLAREIAGAAG